MVNSFYNIKELKNLGLKKIGKNVSISRKCSIYSPENIVIGSNVRIDDFCILSGKITLGNYIHIAAYTALYGKFEIQMDDYTGLSPRCTVFSASDDFSGNYLISPMVPDAYTNVSGGKVTFKRLCQVGSGSIILPAVTLHEGVVVGAMSLVKKDLEAWGIYAGNPVKFIKAREKKVIKFCERIY
jgi:acetyltransferase-like isoleucine patch superfamily enzyme